jgi:hypothetical protein
MRSRKLHSQSIVIRHTMSIQRVDVTKSINATLRESHYVIEGVFISCHQTIIHRQPITKEKLVIKEHLVSIQ